MFYLFKSFKLCMRVKETTVAMLEHLHGIKLFSFSQFISWTYLAYSLERGIYPSLHKQAKNPSVDAKKADKPIT